MAGRRRKLTRKVIDDVAAALSIGATQKIAAGYAGIAERTLYDWRTTGEAEVARMDADPGARPDPDKALYVQFVQSMTEALASAAIKWLQVVDNSARSDPEWAWRMLQAKYPEYREQKSVDVTSGGGAIAIREIVVEMPADEPVATDQ